MNTGLDARVPRAELALIALLVVVAAQVTRLLFPVMFEIGEDWDFLAAGLVALAVFCAPVLAVPASRLRRPVAIVTGSVAAGGALVVAQLLDPIPGLAVMVVVVVALAGAALVVTQLDHDRSRSWFVLAVFLGLGLDVTIRAVLHTWDLPWQTGWAARLAVAALVVGLVIAAVVASRGNDVPGAGVPPITFVVGGALAALELLFLANIGFVASQAGLGLAPASVIVLAGVAGGLLVIASPARLPWPGRVGVVVGLVAVVGAWALPTVTGIAVVPLVVLVQIDLALLFARVAGRPPPDGSTTIAAIGAMTAGSVLFAVVVLLWQLHIDQPLPFPRQVVPALAAAVVAVPALRAPLVEAPTVPPARRTLGAAVALVMVTVPAWLWVTAADPADDPDDQELTVVSYNVRGAVDVDGQLRPDLVADEIRTSDPDVVVLQEVGRGWPIHGTLDLLAYLSRELDMDYVFEPAADHQFGNAILSRLPMRRVAGGVLPKDGTQERSYLLVEVTTTTGPVSVVGTHIQSRSVPQVTALLEAVGTRRPVVLAGDMNIKPPDPEVALFTEAGLVDVIGATGDPCRSTSAEPNSECDRPDWVFVSSDIAIDDARIGSTVASDHLAIHTVLRPD